MYNEGVYAMTLTCVLVRCKASYYKETAFSGFNFILGLNFKPEIIPIFVTTTDSDTYCDCLFCLTTTTAGRM